ncbi:MAG: hypothetical protein AB7I48_17390 [Planctomycetaceae bacterium]
MVVAVLVALGMMPHAGASACEEAERAAKESVRRLIEQLDVDSLSERVAAERELLELGPDILPHLPAVGALSTPAAEDAVRRIRERLERAQAERSVLPSRVTLFGAHALREILEQVQAQTGNAVSVTSLPDDWLGRVIPCKWEGATFWECLESIDRQQDVAVRFHPQDGLLEVVPETAIDEPPVRTASFGAFLVTVRSVTRRPDFTDRKCNVIRVRYDVAAEPRLRPLFVRVNDADFRLTAVAEAANDAEPKDATAAPLSQEARRERPADRPGPVPLSTDFVVPRSWSSHTVHMTGRVEIELASDREAITFRDLGTAEHIIRRRGEVTVTLDKAKFTTESADGPRAVRVDMRVAYDQAGPAFESHRTWVYHNDAFLRLSDESQQWTHNGFDTIAEAEAAVKLSYRFDDVPASPESLEFVYVAPTLVLAVPLQIELADLPVEDPADRLP